MILSPLTGSGRSIDGHGSTFTVTRPSAID
jgi:hypothetical protein